MALFNFTLHPLEQITPWGGADEPQLSWFSLSLGDFWLGLGGQEILRVREDDTPGASPYCDYQLARYWEDLLAMLSDVLEPIPADLVAMRAASDWEQRFARAAEALDAGYVYSPEWLRIEKAVESWRLRAFDFAHLVAAPSVHLCRLENQVHFTWSSRPEGEHLWAPVHGALSMPVETFLDEVRDFDARLLSAMGRRVRSVLEAGGIPGIAVDLERLREEQVERSTWLADALSRSAASQAPGEGSDWEWLRRQLTGATP
jgi:hypothetical protein